MRFLVTAIIGSLFAINAFAANNAYIHNMTSQTVLVSINNGTFVTVPAMAPDSANIMSFANRAIISFVNNTNPGQGEIGIGENDITFFPEDAGPADAQNVTRNVPETRNIPADSYMLIMPASGGESNKIMISPFFFR